MGTPNRSTQARALGFERAGAPPERATKLPRQQPLEFLLNLMDDEAQPMSMRIDAAKAAAPYVHHRQGLIDLSQASRPLQINIIRFTDVADELEPPDRLAEPGPVIIDNSPSTAH